MSNIVDRFKDLVKKKVFTVKFIKADGSERVMNAMLGVSRHVKGTAPLTTQKRSETLYFTNKIGCYEMKGTSKNVEAKNYKTISLDRIIWLKINGKIFNKDLQVVK